jgi:pyruvate kinase
MLVFALSSPCSSFRKPSTADLAVAKRCKILGLDLVVTGTTTGNTARHISSFRPKARIVAVTPLVEVARRLALVWGVESLVARAE